MHFAVVTTVLLDFTVVNNSVNEFHCSKQQFHIKGQQGQIQDGHQNRKYLS